MVILSWCLSWCLGVTSRYRSKTRWDRDFEFLMYDSLESLVFRDKSSCHWVRRVPMNEGKKKGTPLKDIILPLLARLTWRWLQIGTDMLLIITLLKSFLGMSTSMTLNDLESPKLGVSVNFLWFQAVTRISRVNCAEMAGDRPRQPDFSNPSPDLLGSWRRGEACAHRC